MDRADDVRSRQGSVVQLGTQVGTGQQQGTGSPIGHVNLEFRPSLPVGIRLGQLNFPVLLMNVPLSLSAQIPNNAYMHDLSPSEREICHDRAVSQFQSLYKHITQHAMVYLLPSTPGFQDQPYVSNLGAVLPHCEEDTVLISRFRSAPRIGEERTGADFFKLMHFTVERPPETFEAESVYFEGEADLKHIRGNVYIGAHGMRTSRNALAWASERFGMEIVPFRVTNPYLYHLDCCVLRIDEEAVLLCTAIADRTCIQGDRATLRDHRRLAGGGSRRNHQLSRAGGRGSVRLAYWRARRSETDLRNRESQDQAPRGHLLALRSHLARLLHVRILQIGRAALLPRHAHQDRWRTTTARKPPSRDRARAGN